MASDKTKWTQSLTVNEDSPTYCYCHSGPAKKWNSLGFVAVWSGYHRKLFHSIRKLSTFLCQVIHWGSNCEQDIPSPLPPDLYDNIRMLTWYKKPIILTKAINKMHLTHTPLLACLHKKQKSQFLILLIMKSDVTLTSYLTSSTVVTKHLAPIINLLNVPLYIPPKNSLVYSHLQTRLFLPSKRQL